jgi:glycosyltransferase involved in cell wall biosynthesis
VAGPLQGIVVLDLTRILAGPWATQVLADFGAEVLHLPDVADLHAGFSAARNAVLDACTGDWFLWIDADEVLDGGCGKRVVTASRRVLPEHLCKQAGTCLARDLIGVGELRPEHGDELDDGDRR